MAEANDSEFAFDSAYRGEPQPDIEAPIEQGKFRGEVLDAGYGEGVPAMRLAELGYSKVGLDAAPTAVGLVRAEAVRRGLSNVTFDIDDISPARIHVNAGSTAMPGADVRDEPDRRHSLPAWLLTAHLA